MTSHVLISYRMDGGLLSGRLVMPGAPEEEAGDYDPERQVHPGKVRVYDQPGGAARWRKKKDLAKVAFIRTRPAAWVLRKSVITPLLTGVSPREVALVPAELCDDKGVIDDDWVLMHVRATFPVDRDAAVATYANAKNPHASNLVDVQRFEWRTEREARVSIFRTAECPQATFVRRDLFETLAAKLGKVVAVAEPPYAPKDFTPVAPVFTSTWTPDSFGLLPELPAEPEAAGRAAAAFWALYARAQGAGEDARRRVLESPHYAYWLAKVVDSEPREDTRHAACAIPFYGLMYARDVDQRACEETQRAAKRHEITAYVYETLFEGRKDALPEELPIRGSSPIPLPQGRARFAEKDTRKGKRRPTHIPFDDELRSDLPVLLERGLARLECSAGDDPDAVVAAVHGLAGDLQAGRATMAKGELAEVAIAWGEQLVRALGWQWATVVYDDGSKPIGLISPDRSLAHFPQAFLESLAARSEENTVELLFAMLRAPRTPKSKPWSYLPVA